MVTSALLAGCSPSGEPASPDGLAPAAVADRYGYDQQSTTSTPVYALVAGYNNPRDGYARDLLAQRCLQGVVDYVPAPIGDPNAVVDARTLQPMFTAEIAARFGYSADRLSPRIDGAIPDDVEIGPEVDAAMQSCGEQADERLGSPPVRLLTGIEESGWMALDTDEDVAAATGRWRDCMAPAGVVDLPASPVDMPSPSLVTPGTLEVQDKPATGADLPASAREIEVAVQDVRCRAESGFDTAEHDARAEAELAAIGRSLKEFDAVRAEYETYMAGVEQVVAELG